MESVEGEATIRFRTSTVAHEHEVSKQARAVFRFSRRPGFSSKTRMPCGKRRSPADAALRPDSEGQSAMLELESLLLQRWDVYKRSPLSTGTNVSASLPIWAVLEPSSRTLVGLARPGAKTGSFRKRWFSRALLAVYESEDEPLLCTLRHRWSLPSSWELRDADGHTVGKIARRSIQGPMGRNLTVMSSTNAPGTEFLDLQRRRMATLVQQRDGRLLSFAVECERDPFARMLVLGAALVMKDS